MRSNHETPQGKLYHGTSCSALEQIVRSGGICPPATSPELAKRYRLPKAPYPPDQRYVYLVPKAFQAIMFGVVRTVGLKWSHGLGRYEIKGFVKGKDYDSVWVFEVNTEDLNQSLFRKSDLFSGEVAYEGTIDVRSGVKGVVFPMTRRLYEFARDIQTPELLKQYVGMDLIDYLQGEQFEAEAAT
jgi:hypothetical protein